MLCEVCKKAALKQEPYVIIEEVPYHECAGCGSIYVSIQDAITPINKREYDQSYWEDELESSRSRSYGSTLARIAEVFLYSRIPITSFVDIGCGPGFSLEAISALMPNHRDLFWGVEKFPPPSVHRCLSSNYIVGSLASCGKKFSAGICIEVIEHLFPSQLREMIQELAFSAHDGATFYFSSAQPRMVREADPGYLDPYRRGHIASYSLEGLASLFGQYGFSVIPLYGRDWAFLAEYQSQVVPNSPSMLLDRIWSALDVNLDKLKNNGFGPLMYTIGVESSRCYLEAALVRERTEWALSLESALKRRSQEAGIMHVNG